MFTSSSSSYSGVLFYEAQLQLISLEQLMNRKRCIKMFTIMKSAWSKDIFTNLLICSKLERKV